MVRSSRVKPKLPTPQSTTMKDIIPAPSERRRVARERPMAAWRENARSAATGRTLSGHAAAVRTKRSFVGPRGLQRKRSAAVPHALRFRLSDRFTSVRPALWALGVLGFALLASCGSSTQQATSTSSAAPSSAPSPPIAAPDQTLANGKAIFQTGRDLQGTAIAAQPPALMPNCAACHRADGSGGHSI